MTSTASELESLLNAAELRYKAHEMKCITCLIRRESPPAPERCVHGDALRHRRDELRQRVDEAESAKGDK